MKKLIILLYTIRTKYDVRKRAFFIDRIDLIRKKSFAISSVGNNNENAGAIKAMIFFGNYFKLVN